MKNSEMEMIDVEELLQDRCQEAEELLQRPDKVDKMLKKLEKKLRGVPKLGGALIYIPQMAMMVNSYIRGDYKNVPLGIISAILGVLIYFVSPVDLIPDFIPVAGLLDDAAVASGSLYLVKNDLDEYMQWRLNTGLDQPDADEECK